MHTVAMRRIARIVPALLVAMSLAAACSGSESDDDAASVPSNVEDVQSSQGDGPGLVDKPDEPDPTSGSPVPDSKNNGENPIASDETAATSPPVVATVLPTVPETGVPGIDSANLFCRSWSEFAGTFQALALASTFASGDLSAPRSELVASGAIITAVAGLGEHLPAELESERTNLTVDLVGPMERRALRNYSSLEAAGLSTAQIDELAELWLAALVVAGVDEPNIQLDIAGDVALQVDGVARALRSSVPLIRDDPSLVTDASTPLTNEYILENCPDQGTLGGNDVIEQ
jgi:hypothetical protein